MLETQDPFEGHEDDDPQSGMGALVWIVLAMLVMGFILFLSIPW